MRRERRMWAACIVSLALSAAAMAATPATLDIDVNSGSAEPQVPTIIADAWKAVGVNAGLDMVPTAQLNDPRARSSRQYR